MFPSKIHYRSTIASRTASINASAGVSQRKDFTILSPLHSRSSPLFRPVTAEDEEDKLPRLLVYPRTARLVIPAGRRWAVHVPSSIVTSGYVEDRQATKSALDVDCPLLFVFGPLPLISSFLSSPLPSPLLFPLPALPSTRPTTPLINHTGHLTEQYDQPHPSPLPKRRKARVGNAQFSTPKVQQQCP